ncbi:pilus assembly protein [Methylobacterium sp. J-076]|uniref:pilus assembly protein n=1 Tax=Methylobacterium sp. J-076 TaxID=2836655 RepID=UPI001FBA313A|nr:pilus assembly protein TadG-related protein [Methylobacterium sp. J-076]MCJ2013435.1 pilus assembly protein TadG-related protein [Methylobacterium sp. J-076]
MITASDVFAVVGRRIRRLPDLLRRSWADRSGSLTTIFAFSAIPLVGFVGLAVDYGMELAAKSKLDHAADAAVVAAITSAQTYIVNYAGSGDPTASAIAVGKAQALAQFNANTGSLPAVVPAPTVTMTAAGRTLSATATYSFSMPTIFMRALGTTTANFSGTASSTLTIPAFTNIHIVIDVSSSMGIGATLKDQQIVYNATGGCAVACHYSGTTTSARNAGATLRIDVAKNAVVSALNQIISSGNASRFKVAVYTMSSQFTNIYSLSSDLSGAVSTVQGLDISNTAKDGGTNTTYGLKTLGNNLNTDGNGLTSSTAQGFVMLITDGVQDSDIKVMSGGSWVDGYDSNYVAYTPCTTPNCKNFSGFAVPLVVESFDPSSCATIKTKGYTLMTLNTTYIVPPANLQSSSATLNSVFTFIQNYLLSSIASNLSSCASSSTYAYSANSPTEINAAVQQMFAAAGAQARITN